MKKERLCHNCRHFVPSLHSEKCGKCQVHNPDGVKVKGHFMGLIVTETKMTLTDSVCELHTFKYRKKS